MTKRKSFGLKTRIAFVVSFLILTGLAIWIGIRQHNNQTLSINATPGTPSGRGAGGGDSPGASQRPGGSQPGGGTPKDEDEPEVYCTAIDCTTDAPDETQNTHEEDAEIKGPTDIYGNPHGSVYAGGSPSRPQSNSRYDKGNARASI